MKYMRRIIIPTLTAVLFSGCSKSAVTVTPAEETAAVTAVSRQTEPASLESYPETEVYKSVKELTEKCTGIDKVDLHSDYDGGYIKSIDGNYSSFDIHSETDALHSFEQIKELIGMKEPSQELVFYSSETDPDMTVYNFDQYYKGIPVMFGGVRLITDEKGRPFWFTSSLVPDIEKHIGDIGSAMDRQQALKAFQMPDVERVDEDSIELCILSCDSTEYIPVLAYTATVYAKSSVWNDPDKMITIDYNYIIDAHTGSLLYENPLTIVD